MRMRVLPTFLLAARRYCRAEVWFTLAKKFQVFLFFWPCTRANFGVICVSFITGYSTVGSRSFARFTIHLQLLTIIKCRRAHLPPNTHNKLQIEDWPGLHITICIYLVEFKGLWYLNKLLSFSKNKL